MTRIVIIGAPRSGTNMLRDLLCAAPGVATWPCDEINYIWRHGNLRFASDAFTPEMARPAVRKYIDAKFTQLQRRAGATHIVEKTCANSLRVGFVDRVVGDAKYVFIYRNGIDAAVSAAKRWGASLDLAYIARKARFVPLSDLPYYASRYLGNRIFRLFSRQKRLAFWGPALANMPDLMSRHSLHEVCALQWQACVGNSLRDFSALDSTRVHRVRYEDLVSNKADELGRLCGFLGIAPQPLLSAPAFAKLSASSIGRASETLDADTLASLRSLVGGTLDTLGYR